MKTTKIALLVRPNILALQPYSSARDEFKGKKGIFLDANENPFGKFNRYPDPRQLELKKALSEVKNMPVENIFIGNGSDEVIDLVFRIFCTSGKDKIIICPPTYGMYEVSANINDIEIVKIPLDNEFQLNTAEILKTKAKVLFLCSPNNPTGNSLKDIEIILEKFNGIVFLDEAYIDFSTQKSFAERVLEFPNLIVSQTFSKAWGLAAARVGIAYAGKEIIELYNKVKPPYNVSQLNQKAALKALEKTTLFNKRKSKILSQKAWLESQLLPLKIVQKIYPSDANFLLVEVSNATEIYDKLVAQKIVTRNRHSVVKNCIRITVGTAEENQKLVAALGMMC